MAVSTRRFEAVLFDLGETLIYSVGVQAEVFKSAIESLQSGLEESGLNLGADFGGDFSRHMEAYFRARKLDMIELTSYQVLADVLRARGYEHVAESILRKALVEMYRVTQQYWLPEEDALPALESLRESGYRMALVSNAADDMNTQVLVDKLGARGYFEVILSSAAAGIRKPDPQFFLRVLDEMRVVPGRALMVGDTLDADILGAKRAGIFSVWITRRAERPPNREKLGTIQPDETIASLAELPGLLDRLN